MTDAVALESAHTSEQMPAPEVKNRTMYSFEIATAAHDLRNRMSIAQCETRLLRSRVATSDESHEPRLADCLDAIDRSLTEEPPRQGVGVRT